jgi:phage terminase small subunit
LIDLIYDQNMVSNSKGLNPKQRRFVAEYLIDQNATQAAIRAGYRRKNADVVGPRLLGNVGIRAAIDTQMAKVVEQCEIRAEYVLSSLKSIAEKCQQAVPVMAYNRETRRMEKTGQYHFDSAGANRALELIGKHLKLWTDKVDHAVDEDAWEMLDRFTSAVNKAQNK